MFNTVYISMNNNCIKFEEKRACGEHVEKLDITQYIIEFDIYC